jgi:hypothetical protein
MMNADLTPPPAIVVPAEVAPPTREQLVAALDHVYHEHQHPDDVPERVEVSSPDMPPINNESLFVDTPRDWAALESSMDGLGSPIALMQSRVDAWAIYRAAAAQRKHNKQQPADGA